jgi:hypothetical protein
MDTFGCNKVYGSATGRNGKCVSKALKTQRFVRAERCERLQGVAALNYMGCKGSRVQISALRKPLGNIELAVETRLIIRAEN